MAMKSSSDPRRVYSRNDVTHVCYAGCTFGPGKAPSAIRLEVPVSIEGDGSGNVVVTQRKPHAKVIKETWGKVTVPCVAR